MIPTAGNFDSLRPSVVGKRACASPRVRRFAQEASASWAAGMIRSFRSKALRLFAATGDARKLSVPNDARIRRILAQLDSAVRPEDLDLPGYRFHALKGERRGTFAVNANGNFRITFGWDGQDAIDVDLEDYH